jgi:bacillithiol synthase
MPEEYVVTGQQVGFATGPAYTVLKVITAIRLAEQIGVEPLFWAATEDHDVEEVASTYRITPKGDLRRHKVQLPQGKAVEDLPLLPEHLQELERFFEAVGVPMPPINSKRYAGAMIELLQALFPTLKIVEPRELRHLAPDFFAEELKTCEHLFYKTDEGDRVRLKGDRSDLIDQIDRLSPDVHGRPVFQAKVIPTVAYVAGPGEMEYYSKLGPLHEKHGVSMPTLIPRISLTVDRKGATPHYRQNLLHPKGKPQDRLLNWWFLESITEESLLERLLNDPASDRVIEELSLLCEAETVSCDLKQPVIEIDL